MAFVFFVGLMAGVASFVGVLVAGLVLYFGRPSSLPARQGVAVQDKQVQTDMPLPIVADCSDGPAATLPSSRQRLLSDLTVPDLRDMLQRKNHRHTGTKPELVKRLLDMGAGGTDAQAELAERLSRRRGLGLQRPGPEDLATPEDMSRWLAVAQEKQ